MQEDDQPNKETWFEEYCEALDTKGEQKRGGRKAARIGRSTRRCHFAVAGITDVQSVFVGKDGVEESVTSVHCAVGICEVEGNPQKVGHDNDAPFRTSKAGLLPVKFYSTSNNKTEKWQRNKEI